MALVLGSLPCPGLWLQQYTGTEGRNCRRAGRTGECREPGATPYAPVEMDQARNKLRRAEKAMRQEDYNEAKRLADEAQADAELALALTGKAEAEQAVHEMEISIEVLREEIMRSQNQ